MLILFTLKSRNICRNLQNVTLRKEQHDLRAELKPLFLRACSHLVDLVLGARREFFSPESSLQ